MVRRNTTKKQTLGLKPIDTIPLLKCKNQKYGCDVKARKYTCYTRVKYKKNATKADRITLTNRKRGTLKLKTPILRILDWFDCSHFK